VIIAGPARAFDEKDKFVLDQYVMQGGKVLWFIDMVNARLDSISEGGSMVAMIRMLNIEDLLFRYGVRINPVLIQDIQCNMIPVNVALTGSAPDFRPAPWLYSPLLTAPYPHPVTRNLNMIKTDSPAAWIRWQPEGNQEDGFTKIFRFFKTDCPSCDDRSRRSKVNSRQQEFTDRSCHCCAAGRQIRDGLQEQDAVSPIP